MSDTRWRVIPTDIGHALWAALRARMGVGAMDVGVYETCSSPDGQYSGGVPYMLTVVGVRGGDTPLLKCESWGEYTETPLEEFRETGRRRYEWTKHRFCVPDGTIPEVD